MDQLFWKKETIQEREYFLMAERHLSELDTLAHRAWVADRQAMGEPAYNAWEDLNKLTQKRYRAIVRSVRTKPSEGQMMVAEYECSLIASLKDVGIEIVRNRSKGRPQLSDQRGNSLVENGVSEPIIYSWRIPDLDIQGSCASFPEALQEALRQMKEEVSHLREQCSPPS